MRDSRNTQDKTSDPSRIVAVKIGLASDDILKWSKGRSEKTRNNQLSYIPSREGWLVLCEDLWTSKRLGMLLWTV